MSSTAREIEKMGFGGLTVGAFESRMDREMRDLITRNGGKPIVAPSMREIPLTENKQVFDFFDMLQGGYFEVVVLMTGVGTRTLFQILEKKHPHSHIEKVFKRSTVIARGPKSVKALTDYHLKPKMTAPEPNTWREVLAKLEEYQVIKGKRIAVQEYGVTNPEFMQALRDAGAKEVTSVPVYRWALPEDTKPLEALIKSIIHDEVHVVLFTSGNQIHNVLEVAKGLGLEEALREAFLRVVVASIGPIASETLKTCGIEPDLEPEHSKMGFLVKDAAEKSRAIYEKKNSGGSTKLTTGHAQIAKPARKETVHSLQESPFLKACRKEKTSRTPIWIMRQAGRYLPEYQAIRSTVSFLTLCKRPDLAAEVTVKAQEVLGVDAAILFADILLISEPLGFHLEFADHGGPVISDPFRSPADLDRLRDVNGPKDLSYVMDAVRLIRQKLQPHIPLIGFAGAPFTLASYLIEGGGSKDYIHTREIMKGDFGVWDELMKRLVAATTSYLNGQIDAGAQAIQLFDSWVGILTPEEFKRYALPYIQSLIGGLKPVPVIYFGTETHPFFPMLKKTGANVIGVDWRVDLNDAWKQLGDVAVQGNLDPQVLLTDPDNVRKKAVEILEKVNSKPGHIFNLGHGILPSTPMENVRALIETVQNWRQ